MTASIPLQAVRDALAFAVVRRVASNGHEVARFAAYTRIPSLFLGADCSDARRTQLDTLGRPGVATMSRGALIHLLHRHRAQAGLVGVRRTWGAGMRQLQAEFADGALR